MPGGGEPAPSRVWVDAQLAPALARWLAAEPGVVGVTKDVDFVELLARRGPPQPGVERGYPKPL